MPQKWQKSAHHFFPKFLTWKPRLGVCNQHPGPKCETWRYALFYTSKAFPKMRKNGPGDLSQRRSPGPRGPDISTRIKIPIFRNRAVFRSQLPLLLLLLSCTQARDGGTRSSSNYTLTGWHVNCPHDLSIHIRCEKKKGQLLASTRTDGVYREEQKIPPVFSLPVHNAPQLSMARISVPILEMVAKPSLFCSPPKRARKTKKNCPRILKRPKSAGDFFSPFFGPFSGDVDMENGRKLWYVFGWTNDFLGHLARPEIRHFWVLFLGDSLGRL